METKTVSKSRIAWVLAGLMVSLLLAALDTTIVGTAMKRIVGDLQGIQYYAWPFSIYMLCSTIAIPVFGGLADIIGRKPVILTGIFTFLIGSVLCGTAQDMTQLIIYRGVQGIGGGVIISIIFTVIADFFEPAKRGKYTGIVTSMYGLASVIGPLLGGLITDQLSWRWIFYVNIPLGLIAAAIVIFALPRFKPAGKGQRIDFAGVATLLLALVPLLLALSWGGRDYPWGSWTIIGMLVFSALMLAAFILVESKVKNPIMPLSFFKNRAISVSMVIAFFTNALMFGGVMFIPYFAQGVMGSTATVSGAVTIPMMIGLLVASNITGFLMARTGRARFWAAGAFALVALGMFLLSLMGVDTQYYEIVLFMVVLGLGIGINMPIANVCAQNAAPRAQLGAVTSAVQFSRNIGATVGSAVFGTIMTSSLAAGLAKLDLSQVPENVKAVLGNVQVITDQSVLAQIRAQVPQQFAGFFDAILHQARVVLAGAIHDVFFFCIFAAAAAFIVALFLKEVGVRAEKKEKAPVEPVKDAELDTGNL